MPISLTDEQVARGPRYSRLRRFFATAQERHLIYHYRQAGKKPPWTNDPIFQKYRFCNVYREHDKVTVWIRENWREPYAEHKNLALAMTIARLINWPPTLEEIGFPEQWDPKKVKRIVKARQARNEKVYTGAYMLGSIPPGSTKIDYFVDDVLTPLYCKLLIQELPSTLEASWNWFKNQHGLGSFLAYEIVTDLRHTHYLRNAPDIMTWANAGPGALRGLTRLWGYQPTVRHHGKKHKGFIFPKSHALSAMQLLLAESQKRLPDDMPAWEMREVEHWLCEGDKIERVRLGQGTLDRFVPMSPNQWEQDKKTKTNHKGLF